MKNLKHKKPDMSVFTDASVYTDRKSAGWGGWAKGDYRPKQLLSGLAPFHKNTGFVELYAIMGMLETLKESGYLLESDKSIIIQSDSVIALGYLLNSLSYSAMSKLPESADISPKSPPAVVIPIIERIHMVLQNSQIIYLRHVRSHRNDSNTRHGVNNMCDVEAKKKARQEPMELPEWLPSEWLK